MSDSFLNTTQHHWSVDVLLTHEAEGLLAKLNANSTVGKIDVKLLAVRVGCLQVSHSLIRIYPTSRSRIALCSCVGAICQNLGRYL